ncbi:MAG: type I methionyl aminopeptidase [Clostridiales bacterium]|uniref:type I methionyl aminopeptidase n=1 Tax=Roseburia sp. MSJ-14 TaxID=2841514 RepID=UPI00169C0BE1|nr:type I methionyl aminopeptidase [Roseburia sp. MSJ-14]MBU5473290.1 type I methionyl aminopeptidase [Roseburia sp. MSJ-14]NLK77081.1 type I methionyl aminopeptidase [Clostridiales bacterium]
MSVSIKSAREIELMRAAGKILAKVHENLGKELKPGMSTWEIDKLGEEMIRSFGCIPSFKNYNGYPAAICVSVNNEVVHGIPTKKHLIHEGDIVSLDAGVIYKGYHSDAARTHGVGEISKEAALLIERTRQSFFEGIKYAKDGNHLHEISNAIGAYAESFGYGVVRELVGHGIGTHLHEDPQIPNFAQKSRGVRLKSGMTLAVEPMINAGRPDVEWLSDDWTVVTEDGSLSAHYENTILITDGEPEILTLTETESNLGIGEPKGEDRA